MRSDRREFEFGTTSLGRKNGKLRCPECGGKLGGDKDPLVSDGGFIYRHRICCGCYADIRTKQGLEEITHVEVQHVISREAV